MITVEPRFSATGPGFESPYRYHLQGKVAATYGEMWGPGFATFQYPNHNRASTVDGGVPTKKLWMQPVTENPLVGATDVWEMFNTTGDAHPMHVHEVVFEVVNREGLVLDAAGEVAIPVQPDGNITLPEPWETAFKDTVIAYDDETCRLERQQLERLGRGCG